MQAGKVRDSKQVGVALICAKESKYSQEYFSSYVVYVYCWYQTKCVFLRFRRASISTCYLCSNKKLIYLSAENQ